MSIPKVSIQQVKAARALLGWSQDGLAEKSGVSVPTIKRLEAEPGPIGGRPETARLIVAALQDGGVLFIDADTLGPGVRLADPPKVA